MSTISTYKRRITRSLEGCKLRLSFRLALFEEGYCLDLFGFLIALPFLDRWAYDPFEIMESWGFTFFERSVHLNWGRKYKIIRMPWDWEHIKCEVLRPDGVWVPYVGSYEDKEPDGRKLEEFSYQYVLKSGEVQHRIATVYVERREWRRKWMQWCPWFARKEQSIDVSFDGEVGEQTGSWKGGTIGCGWTMLPGETTEQTLRRMERERKFS